VLQAGIHQSIDSKGQVSYYAWWEWYVPNGDDKAFPYIDEQKIGNFLVSPGDKISCSVAYVHNKTAGQVALANYTSGQYFSHIAPPPTGATFNASSIEWIMEAPSINGVVSVLPNFTPVNFFQAFGWTAGEKAVGDPQNGDYVNIVTASGQRPTSVSLGSLSVSIDFIG